jgi:HAE1 family hydrophobic/amphiphilic exporter-1
MDYEISYDVSNLDFYRKVIHTLIEAFILVGLVVFLLRRLAVYNNPRIAVPVSLVGTLFHAIRYFT